MRRLNDIICIENGYSIVENPKRHGKSYNKWLGDKKKPSHRERICAAIDDALAQKPDSFEALLELLRQAGYEVKGKKVPSLLGGEQKKSIRMDTLGDGTFYFRPQNNVVLEAGSRYKYTVKVNTTGLTLEGCTIGSWVDGGGESGAAEDLGYSIQNDGSYMVYNADGLLAWNKAAQKDESINCTLTADIDLTGKDWTRIGTWPGYSGVFNGQGHRITGLNFSAATTELFGLLNERGVIKNLQLIDVNLYGNSGSAAGIVEQNNGQIIACSVTGKISAYGRTSGIAYSNYGDIIACWFDGTLKEYESGAIVCYNYAYTTSCYWGGNAGQGVFSNLGGKVDATKVDGATVKWQTAVDGMNTALTNNDYQWALGTDGLPVLQKRQ